MTHMNWINLTPHEIRVLNPDKTVNLVILPSGQVARFATRRTLRHSIGGVPIYTTYYVEVTGLPDAGDGKLYVVSLLIKSAVPSRRDVFSPGDLVRDAAGQPIGCIGLDSNGEIPPPEQ